MRMTVYYVVHARYDTSEDRVAYIAGPFGSYHEALDAKRNSNFITDNLDVVEQEIQVKE